MYGWSYGKLYGRVYVWLYPLMYARLYTDSCLSTWMYDGQCTSVDLGDSRLC